MRMKMYAVLSVLFTALVVSFAEEPMLSFRISNCPLEIVLSDYAEKANKRVELVDELAKGISGTVFSIKSDHPVTIPEYLHLIETELRKANIGLFPISTNRLVATWLDLSRLPARPVPVWHAELQERRIEALHQGGVQTPLSPETNEGLRQYQMDLIRKGRAPLPIPLTQEMDEQLVKEGVLPPLRQKPATEQELRPPNTNLDHIPEVQ